MSLSGWGRVPVVPGTEVQSEQLEAITRDVPLTRGLGRAYGDAALPAAHDSRVAGSARADRILAFDDATGELTAEAGLSLDQLYRALLPRGWFTPVSPGTRFVTLGGMIAADIHGKNHHRDGCFGAHVSAITLRVADGRIVTCSPSIEAELFRATVGGMGLTGHILRATVQLAHVGSPWIVEQIEPIGGIDGFPAALKASGSAWPLTAGWIDCLSKGAHRGRGTLIAGRWAESDEAPARFPTLERPVDVPFLAPDALLHPSAVRLFNAAYYHYKGRSTGVRVVHPAAFFYPLDGVGAWHRLYGRRGFVQYQCVLPFRQNRAAVRELLDVMARHRAAAFLGVIKDCGAEGGGMLSFPKPGISLALDIPFNGTTQALVDEMNELTIAEGGRIYLAKDALTRPEHFRAMEPRLDEFLRIRRKWDPEGRIRSALSVRLFGW